MAFVAICPECRQVQVCAVSAGLGLQVKCRGCRTTFRAGGAGEAPVRKQRRARKRSATRSRPAAVTAAVASAVTTEAEPPQPVPPVEEPVEDPVPVTEPVAVESMPEAPAPPAPTPTIGFAPRPVSAPAPAPVPAKSPVRPRPAKRQAVPEADDEVGLLRLQPLGLLALFLLAGALVCAAFATTAAFVLPLVGASVVLGLVSIWSAYRTGHRLLLPIAISLVAGGVLAAALANPRLLGPTYAAYRQPPESDSEIKVIPHPQYLRDPEVRSAEWVDASKATIQQGRTRVEVLDAGVGQARAVGTTSEPRRYLLVRIRLRRAKTGDEIAADAFAPPLVWSDEVRATLWDSSGERYEQRPVSVNRAGQGGPSSYIGVNLDVSDEVLAFEIPPAPSNGLRLELPAEAWGGSGTLKFAIPRSMIKR
jgi:hypothetical protein